MKNTPHENAGHCVVLGVTGSIAAYKAADLTSKLIQAGCEVHVVMTASATKLVQPRTFMTLSRQQVTVDLWNTPDWRPEHIELAARAGLLLVAPATANIIAKLAHGIADDALSSFALAHSGPVLVAPAMNPRMWQNPVVQENCRILRGRGVLFVGPDPGRVACGPDGPGRFAAVEEVLRAALSVLATGKLPAPAGTAKPARQAMKLLVTAGPTREAIDPVRYISNRSSGKMGYAIAAAGVAAGMETTLVSGPVAIEPPAGCRVLKVTTAAEMAAAVKREFPACDALVMCAAVADYRPARASAAKIKKTAASLEVRLERTEDILAAVAGLRRPGQRVMGFAAETGDPRPAAAAKLRAKKLDWIVANDVSRTDAGFDTDTNRVTIISAAGLEELPLMPKTELAARLVAMLQTAATAPAVKTRKGRK